MSNNRRWQRWAYDMACFFIPALVVFGLHVGSEEAGFYLADGRGLHANEPMMLAVDQTGIPPRAQPLPPTGVRPQRPATLQIPNRRPVVVRIPLINLAPLPPLAPVPPLPPLLSPIPSPTAPQP